jgi:hypothetical protein
MLAFFRPEPPMRILGKAGNWPLGHDRNSSLDGDYGDRGMVGYKRPNITSGREGYAQCRALRLFS